MPIRTTTVNRHRTLAGLAKAVFDTGNHPETIEKTVEALRRANPQLAENAALQSGMTLFVPKVEGVGPGVTRVQTGHEALADLAVERAKSLAQLAGRPLDAVMAAARERAEDTRSPATVRTILRARPDMEEHIATMQAGAAREAERIQAAVEKFRATMETLIEDLGNRASGTDS